MPITTPSVVRRLATPQTAVLAVLIVGALLLRWSLFDVVSGDYRSFLSPWYDHLVQAGGFPGLGDEFSNYNTPYLVLLAGLTYLPIDPLVGIKLISVVFDLVLALFCYRIVQVVRPEARWLPTVLTGVVLFAPTVVMNSSAWGQCDSIYGSMILASLYFLITRRPWRAALFFGIAFAFKLQAVFFLPVIVLVLVSNRHKLRTLIAAPVAFGVMLVPALIAGRSLLSQLAIYPAQITGGSAGAGTGAGDPGRGMRGGGPAGGGPGGGGPGGGGDGGGFGSGGTGGVGTGHAFTANAPTPYAWLPSDAGEVWKYVGLLVAAGVALTFGIWLLRRRRALTAGDVLVVAAASTMVIPWLLPEMHERYFYLAQVLLLLAIAADRRAAVPAVAIQAASTITYLSYLRGTDLIPLELTAVLGLIAAAGAAVVLVLHLRRPASVARDLTPPQPEGQPRDQPGDQPAVSSGRTSRPRKATSPSRSDSSPVG